MTNLDTKLTLIDNSFNAPEKVRYKKLAEECVEYLEAYFKNDRVKLKSEAADVHNVVRGLLISDKELYNFADIKAERTINRLETGYYKKEIK